MYYNRAPVVCQGEKPMLDRRRFLSACSGLGLGGTLFPGVLWAQAQSQGAAKITKEMIDQAAAIADVPIPEETKEMMLDNLNQQVKSYDAIYALHIPNSVAPCLIFDPVVPGTKFETERRPSRISKVSAIAAHEARQRIWRMWRLPACANSPSWCELRKCLLWRLPRCI